MDIPKHIHIRQLKIDEAPPFDLLYLADPSIDFILTYIKRSEIYVAELKNKIVGTCVLYPLTRRTMEIKNIAVDGNFQGRGLGKLLLEEACKIAKIKGYNILKIGTANSSIRQLQLYQKQGFEITEIKKNFFLENYEVPIYENGIQCKHLLMLSKYI